MARVSAAEWVRGGGSKCCCSFKRITFVICCVNLVAALLVIRSFHTSFFFPPSSGLSRNSLADQTKRMEESIRIRREMEPLALVSAARMLRMKLSREEKKGRVQLPRLGMHKLASEILQRLHGVGNTNVTEQRAAVNLWRVQKLEEVRKATNSKSSNSSIPFREAKMLKQALETNWPLLMEGIGLWIPSNVINTQHDDKPEDEPDFEIIPGRPMPPECNAELHTDYDGAAVRWGLTHHKESAADCCQACLDQAKRTKPGGTKCNIWVYCPSEFGCYSPDIYEHKHQECWLKQAATPRLNFKGKYSESYRNNHRNAPVVVPWMSELPQIDLPVQVDMEVEHEQLRNDIQGRRHQDQMVPSLTPSLVRVEEEELSIASSHASDSRAEVPSPTDLELQSQREATDQAARHAIAPQEDVTQQLSPIGLDHAEHSMGHSSGSWRESGVVPVWSPPTSSCSGLFGNDGAGITSSSYLDRHPHSRQLMNWGQLSQTTLRTHRNFEKVFFSSHRSRTRSWEIDNTLQPNAIG